MADEQQYCTFFLDGQYFGIDVRKVQEIIRQQPMTRVPLAPPVVRGLINLRGQIVTAIDLRRRLEFSDRAVGQAPVNVVVETGDGAVSLLVDEIGDVLTVRHKTLESLPDTLQGAPRGLLLGVHPLPDRLLLILDIDKVVNLAPKAR